MVATTYHYDNDAYEAYQNNAKMNDIFEQTVIIDKPLSKTFYDSLKEVTIDAEIIIGRLGVIEEIVPLEQWESVISDTFPETQDEEWVIEPEETIYTVVKWEGIEGGEKHIVENKQWKEVSHSPAIHTKYHVSPLDEFDGGNTETKFTFPIEENQIQDSQSKHTTTSQIESQHNTVEKENSNRAEITFTKPHVSERTETTWHVSNHTSSNHHTMEAPKITANGYTNGYMVSQESNDNPLGAWHKIEHPIETTEKESVTSSSPTANYLSQEHKGTWHKTHVNQPTRSLVLERMQEFSPTRIPKPLTNSPTTPSKPITPESPKYGVFNGETKITPPKPSPRTHGATTTVFSTGYSPQPLPQATHHHFIAAKPASHNTFMTSYTTTKNNVSTPESIKSPPRTPGTTEKVTWRRTHGNQYVREMSTNFNS